VGLGVLGPHPEHDVPPLVLPQGSIAAEKKLPMEGVIRKKLKHPKAWIGWMGFNPGRDGLPSQYVTFNHGLDNLSHTAFSQELTNFHGDEMLGLHFLSAPTSEFDALDGDPGNGLNNEIGGLGAVYPDEALVVRPAVLLEFEFWRWLTLDLESQRLVVDIDDNELELGLGEGELVILPGEDIDDLLRPCPCLCHHCREVRVPCGLIHRWGF
jgi:hypothetical protein